MRRLITRAVASWAVLGFAVSGPALAQAVRPTNTGTTTPYAAPYNPTLSPYLNLLRPGGAPAINYYGLVRPQQAYNYAINSLDQQVAYSRVAATAAENQAAPSTGHPIYFLNYQKFFLNLGAQAPFQNLQATAGAGAGAGTGAGSRFTSSAAYGAKTPGRY
jgi:hypothetical protein